MSESEEISGLISEIEMGAEAEELLKHPLIIGFFSASEKHFLSEIKQTDLEQDLKRDDLFRKIQLVDWLKSFLEHHVVSGEMAKQKIEYINSEEDI